MTTMQTRGRSTLIGTSPRLVGCAFLPHPKRDGYTVNLCAYRLGDEWLLASSEGPSGAMNPEKQYGELGAMVNGAKLARFVERSIQGLPAADFKSLMESAVAATWHWWEGMN